MKHCVITGAADGIGRALAQRFAAAGYAITGIDVDAARAEQTRTELGRNGASVTFSIADLTRESEREQVLAHLENLAPVDIFIHNAGINHVAPFASSSLEHQNLLLDLNLAAPLHLTAGVLRRDRMAPGSTLVFIASLSYFTAYPGAAVYAASKDGLASYARSLSVALAREGKHVLTVFPGPTRTAHARRYSPDNRREHRRMPPERLAELIYRAVQHRRRTLVPGLSNQVMARIGHYLPPLAEWLMRWTIYDRLEA